MPPGVPFSRRLQAIIVLDVAGYSRLMSSEESQTHARVNELFDSVVKPLLRAHGGREIERAGDGLLVLFESSTAALRSALQVQRAVANHQEDATRDRRLLLRIGINVGDIIIDGDEIAGGDVNVAARLQTLAEPGHICITGAVYEQLRENLECSYVDRGSLQLKNITRPVRVFEVRPSGAAAETSFFDRAFRSAIFFKSKYIGRATLALAAAIVVYIGYISLRHEFGGSLLDPPPMSIAILPFRAVSNEYSKLASELTPKVARRLAATGWISVTSPDEVESFARGASGAISARRGLNVRYTVTGTVKTADNKVVIDAEMSDTGRSVAVWTSHATSTEGDISSDGSIVGNLVVQLREAIYAAEAKRLLESGAKARTAMEHKMLGDEERQQFVTLESDRRARVHYERAMALDPSFGPAIIATSYMLLSELDLDPRGPSVHLIEQADALSKQAVSREPTSAPAWQLRSEVLARKWMWDAAIDASDRAIELDPGRAFAFGHRGSLLIRMGRPQEALMFTERAMALAEQRSGYALFQRCRALMAVGSYAASAEACEKSLAREEWWLQRAYLLGAYALLGRTDKAKSELKRLLVQEPSFSIERIRALKLSNVPTFEDQAEATLYRGLRLAGVSEGQ